LGLIFVLAALPLAAEQTVNIIVNSQTGQFVLGESGSVVGSEGRLAFGFLDTNGLDGLLAEDRIPELNEFAALFEPLDEWAFDDAGVIQLLGEPMQSNRVGDQLYVFVYTIDERFVGFYTSSNALWRVPQDPGGATLSSSLIDQALVGEIVAGSPKTFELRRLMRDPYPVELWLLAQLEGNVSEEGLALGADPDGDGLSNLAEYALHKDPSVPDSVGALTRETIPGTWTFAARSNDAQLTYVLELSLDLLSWESLELAFDPVEKRWEMVDASSSETLDAVPKEAEGVWTLSIGGDFPAGYKFARVRVEFEETTM
jgi:hypothetical protein